MAFLRALLVAALAAKAAGQISDCSSHDQCLDDEYCLHYELEGYSPISYCQRCIDEYGFSCSGYGLSIDNDCSKCAAAEADNGDVHEYIGCESSSGCADNMYCYSSMVGTVPYTLQDCYPCVDDAGYTCQQWGDSIDGCSHCDGASQAIPGCTTHGACVEGFYCASYQSQGGAAVVDCMPCIDFLGYGCSEYGDSIDGSCQPCDGVTEAPSDYYGYGYGGYGEMGDCINPGDDNSPVALQECSAHSDCDSSDYCSSYMGFGGCIVQCWPCLDASGISCEEYGDAIDGSCTHCPSGAPGGAVSGGDEDDDDDDSGSGSTSSAGAISGGGESDSAGRAASSGEGSSGDECHGHDNCKRGMYCAEKEAGNACVPCQSSVGGCEEDLDAVDGSCDHCAGYKLDAAAGATVSDDLDPWHVFGVVVASVGGACVLLLGVFYGGKAIRRKLNPERPWDTRNQLQDVDGAGYDTTPMPAVGGN